MEIGISKKGDLQILSVKGKIHLQNWRVIENHLDAIIEKGGRWVALDLSETTLICSTGVGSVLHNVRKFQERECALMVVAETPYVRELFQMFGCDGFMGEFIYSDWRALEKRLQSQGLAVKG